MVLIHIFAGLLAIAAGGVALAVLKGGKLHRESGTIFVYSMMVMSGMGAVLAAMKVFAGEGRQLQSMNVVAGTLTFYLVTTALLTVRRRPQGVHPIDAIAMAIALAAGIFAVKFGVDAANGPKGRLLGYPALPALIFGTIALLAAFGDARLMMGRVLHGADRIARHLWRMCLGMFIATASFFLGQAKVLPESMRIFPLLAIPVVLVLVLMFYWWVRVSILKRVPQAGRDAGRDPVPSQARA
jgi:uncharacterized membrane protein